MGSSLCKPHKPLIRLNINCVCIKGAENDIEIDKVDGEENFEKKEELNENKKDE